MILNRRLALGATLAATAAPFISSTQAQQAPASVGQVTSYYRYRVGDIEVTAVNDGTFSRPLDGLISNAPLPEVKKALIDAFLPDDKLTIPFTSLVLRTSGKLVLIDAGNGDNGPATTGAWMRNFRAAGFDPAEVDQVVFSHFHSDHISGSRLKDGTAVFPRAELAVPAAEWAFWMDDARMAAASEAMKGAFANVRRVLGPVAGTVKRFEWDREVAPGVTAINAVGHTPGHTAFAITSGAGRMLVLSDTANHPALFVRNPDWSGVFDMDGDQARSTRRRLLDMAAADRMQVAFYHAPFPATGFIAREGNTFRMVPVDWQPAI